MSSAKDTVLYAAFSPRQTTLPRQRLPDILRSSVAEILRKKFRRCPKYSFNAWLLYGVLLRGSRMRTVKQSRAKDNKKCRRGLRLRGYDYSRAGAYFVTLCAADRRRLFGEIVDDQMVDNPYAKLGRRCWEDLPNHYAHVTLDASVIMPNHVHGIIVLSGYDANDAPGRHGLAEIMRALKTYSARRGYYEPIVRDENALARIREYIVANPRN